MLLTFLMVFSPGSLAWADPCGMVPPVWLGDGAPITRIGAQKTYVFYKDGIETFVIRPGFSGKVDEFGMLIPFPSPPAMRKVAEDVFPHVAAAIDPPEVVVDLSTRYRVLCCDVAAPSAAAERELSFKRESGVRVLREEAVGMYEVAVLEAGSVEALKRWMDDHGFRYPDGMDATCADYVELGWCFVAVRARVGQGQASEARPGMREVDTALPAGATFDGHVQAMGFRFRTDEFVLPMRLSAFNEGELHNVVYILTDGPQRIANIPQELVVRQIPGWQLHGNLTDPLPLRVIGGNLDDIPEWRLQNLPNERNPLAHNGIARDLFASDLLAVQMNRLIHPHEEQEKALLAIGEHLNLRGVALDGLHAEALSEAREQATASALEALRGMTLTVVDGDFPRAVLAAENLSFACYEMPTQENGAHEYDAKLLGPAPALGGTITGGGAPSGAASGGWMRSGLLALACLALCIAGGAWMAHRKLRRFAVVYLPTALAVLIVVAPGRAQVEADFVERVQELAYPIEDAETMKVLVACGPTAVSRLIDEGLEGSSMVSRGWAIVALTEIGGEPARQGIARIENGTESQLVRTWATAARVELCRSPAELAMLSQQTLSNPALERPVQLRWLELLEQADGTATLEAVLEAMLNNHALQTSLAPAILAFGPGPMIEVLTRGTSQGARNRAAAYLATFAMQGNESVAGEVIEAYRFDVEARQVPWSGGPLFVPSLGWSAEQAQELTGELIEWHLWCEQREARTEQTQIHNNLNSISLAQVAGYSMPSWSAHDSDRWLLAWGAVIGRAGLERLLAEQGLANERRYVTLLSRL